MATLEVMTCEEFWRGLLADENRHQRRREITLRIKGWTSVNGIHGVSFTGGNIWGCEQSSNPVELAHEGINILSETTRELWAENHSIIDLTFDLQRQTLHVFVDGQHRVSKTFL